MRPFTPEMIKLKHTSKIKLTEEKKLEVQVFSKAKVPLYKHFRRTSDLIKTGHMDGL
jgi:hypothetical protein